MSKQNWTHFRFYFTLHTQTLLLLGDERAIFSSDIEHSNVLKLHETKMDVREININKDLQFTGYK